MRDVLVQVHTNMARHVRILALCLTTISLVGLCCSFYLYHTGFIARIQRTQALPTDSTLGVMSGIYVVSLPQRTERRKDMERLRKHLGLRWTYFPAITNDSSVIHAIMQRVKMLREECGADCNFSWPGDLNSSAFSMKPLNLWNPDFLAPASLQHLAETWLSQSIRPLTCATENSRIPEYTPKLPWNRLLTQGRVACWQSHLSVIQLISNEERLGLWSSVLVLEDDVDMESDIKFQLHNLWPLLPADWDIVFLGESLSCFEGIDKIIYYRDRSLLVGRITIEATN